MSAAKAKKWAGITAEELRERWGREHVHVYGAVTSTNDVAEELAEEGEPEGTIVVAREQSEGKGRSGKRWASPPGAGVYLSMLFRPRSIPSPVLVQVLAGLGVVRALDRSFPGLAPALKWPNDVIVEDRKCGGVLAEATWGDGGVRHLVVGVGVNVRPLPEDVPAGVRAGASSLADALEEDVGLPETADAVVSGLEEWLADPPPRLEGNLLELVDRYDWLADRRVRAREEGAEEALEGVCVGIAPDGALLFRPDRGALRRLRAATVEPAG